MGKPAESLPIPPGVGTIGALAIWLHDRDSNGRNAFANSTHIRAAVNQHFATPETPIADGDEIAFFPPVTGG